MQYSAEFIILAPPFERNFQITWQKSYIARKVDSEGKTPLAPIHSGLACERPAWTEIITATSPENQN
jgi:hypothetical protein